MNTQLLKIVCQHLAVCAAGLIAILWLTSMAIDGLESFWPRCAAATTGSVISSVIIVYMFEVMKYWRERR